MSHILNLVMEGVKACFPLCSKLDVILLSFLCQMCTTQGTDSAVVAMNQQQKSSKVKGNPGNSSTKKKSNDKWRQQSEQLREVTDCVITHCEVIFSTIWRCDLANMQCYDGAPPPNRPLRRQGLLARLRKKEKASEYVEEQCYVGFATVQPKIATLVICFGNYNVSCLVRFLIVLPPPPSLLLQDLPVTYSEPDPTYVQCPHCSKRFNQVRNILPLTQPL